MVVPFIYEQIGVLSDHVEAIYIETFFCNLYDWIRRLLGNRWFKKVESKWLTDEGKNVTHYRVYLPKLSTRLTRNSIYRDYELASYWLCNRIIKKVGSIDLIHLHTVLPLGAFALGIKKRLNIPFVLQEHSAPFEMHFNNNENKYWVRQILKNASKVIAVGPGLERRLRDIVSDGREKLCVIPNIVRTDVFEISDNNVGRTINLISVGGLVERKGYDLFIKAVHLLRSDGLDIHAWIVGEGVDRPRLEELIESLKLEHAIILTGHLSRFEINSLMDSMNIYVHSSYRETFGIAPAEAMLKGRVVVSTICEGPEYYVNDENGILVEAGSYRAIAEGIRTAILNLRSHRYDVNKIRASVSRKFGEEGFVKNVLDVYSKIG